MYKKRHLVMTAAATAVFVWVVACFYFLVFSGYEKMDVLTRAKKTIQTHYVNELTEEQQKALDDVAIAGMVYSLEDPYSQYLNTEALEAYAEDKAEEFVGIGINISFSSETNEMKVVTPYENSPAQKAGIRPGDIIRKVGETVVSAETYDAVLEYIKSGEDDEILLEIEREGKTFSVSVIRENIVRQTVTHRMFGQKIGYIRISEFILQSVDDFKKALEDLKSMGMTSLVIDLRNNPGGYADSVMKMTDLLLPKGTIAYLEDNHGEQKFFYSDETSLDISMVVLINKKTASAAELMAGSLQAYEKAVIIGEKSYGKAVGQKLYPLTASTAIYLTDSRYYTPKGECIDGKGIIPDIELAMDKNLTETLPNLPLEQDAQLSKAIEVLKEKTAQ